MVPSKSRIIIGFGVNIQHDATTASLSDWINPNKISKEVLMVHALTEFEDLVNYLDDKDWDENISNKFNQYFMHQ